MIKFVVILAVIVLITIIALMLGRALRGPTVFNRMNALGVISADTIILIVLFGYLDGRTIGSLRVSSKLESKSMVSLPISVTIYCAILLIRASV